MRKQVQRSHGQEAMWLVMVELRFELMFVLLQNQCFCLLSPPTNLSKVSSKVILEVRVGDKVRWDSAGEKWRDSRRQSEQLKYIDIFFIGIDQCHCWRQKQDQTSLPWTAPCVLRQPFQELECLPYMDLKAIAHPSTHCFIFYPLFLLRITLPVRSVTNPAPVSRVRRHPTGFSLAS
jgi:hypothetical protein